MEAAGLALFMVSACVFATLLEHPASPVRVRFESAGLRRLLMGGRVSLLLGRQDHLHQLGPRRDPVGRNVNYAASKGGVILMMKSIAQDSG